MARNKPSTWPITPLRRLEKALRNRLRSPCTTPRMPARRSSTFSRNTRLLSGGYAVALRRFSSEHLVLFLFFLAQCQSRSELPSALQAPLDWPCEGADHRVDLDKAQRPARRVVHRQAHR